MKIAAFINNRGRCLPLYSQGVIRLYSDEGGSWQPILDFLFALPSEQGMEPVRETLMSLLTRLTKAGCQDLIARSILGFPRSIIDGMGFRMWSLDGTPEGHLARIRDCSPGLCPEPDSMSAGADDRRLADAVEFIEMIGEGSYRINLSNARALSGKTSKQLLLPLLQARPFNELEVIADHLPKWFGNELERLGFSCQSQADEAGQIHATLALSPSGG